MVQNTHRVLIVFIYFITLCGVRAKDESIVLKSSEEKAHLIELYTSQSCSSCPPADKWMNRFRKNDSLWKKYVPVQFHVDYWNYLNWKDRFSKSEYSQRQRYYHSRIGAGVYTPQAIVDGRDFNWRLNDISKISSPKIGVLSGAYIKETGQLNITYNPSNLKIKDHICFATILGGGLETKIRGGENQGLFLTHDFVGLEFKQEKMKLKNEKYECQMKIKFEDKKKLKPKRTSLAIWVVEDDTYRVLQATGSDL